MKALMLSDKNQGLTLKEVEDPLPSQGEALVQVHAAALNHRDLWIQKGLYAGLKYPVILGSDGAGVVHSIGSSGDSSMVGKEVIINPSLYWGEEQSHQHPKEFRILGMPDPGTFSEWVRIPSSNLALKPTQLSFEEAAAVPLAGLTAYRAVFSRGQLKSGEKILITGIGGGVALFALQFATAIRANAYVTSGKDEKLESARKLGASGGANYSRHNWVDELRQQAGSFDLIIDGAAGNDFNHLLDLTAPGGRLVTYGATRGPVPTLEMRRIFWKQLNILGSTMGSPNDFQSMISFLSRHQIKPVIDQVFAFSEGEQAMIRMDKAEQFGKIVIKIK